MLVARCVVSTSLLLASGIVILYASINFTRTTVPSNCSAGQTACDPHKSTPSLVFWASRANASHTREYISPAAPLSSTTSAALDYDAVMSRCRNTGLATSTLGEDNATADIIFLVFTIYMITSAVCNILFESLAFARSKGYMASANPDELDTFQASPK
jgi:hypothetical protein